MKARTPEELQQIIAQIDAIDWSHYDTAYGNASGIETRPRKRGRKILPMSITMRRHRYLDEDCRNLADTAKWLKRLFSEQEKEAREAALNLDASLCHQHIMVADASLPAYDILVYCLRTTDSAMLIEDLLDLFYGFAICTSKIQEGAEWTFSLREKMLQDKALYASYLSEKDDYTAIYAKEICALLQTPPIMTQ
ncbi:MAG: hypothetical protein ACI4XB_08960 [Ruminococcus sp.]